MKTNYILSLVGFFAVSLALCAADDMPVLNEGLAQLDLSQEESRVADAMFKIVDSADFVNSQNFCGGSPFDEYLKLALGSGDADLINYGLWRKSRSPQGLGSRISQGLLEHVVQRPANNEWLKKILGNQHIFIADINAVRSMMTLFQVAAQSRNQGAMEMLVEFGADPSKNHEWFAKVLTNSSTLVPADSIMSRRHPEYKLFMKRYNELVKRGPLSVKVSGDTGSALQPVPEDTSLNRKIFNLVMSKDSGQYGFLRQVLKQAWATNNRCVINYLLRHACEDAGMLSSFFKDKELGYSLTKYAVENSRELASRLVEKCLDRASRERDHAMIEYCINEKQKNNLISAKDLTEACSPWITEGSKGEGFVLWHLGLLLKRADRIVINGLGDSGLAPLHCAVFAGSVRGVKALLEAGADPNVKSKEKGFTAFDYVKDNCRAKNEDDRQQILAMLNKQQDEMLSKKQRTS